MLLSEAVVGSRTLAHNLVVIESSYIVLATLIIETIGGGLYDEPHASFAMTVDLRMQVRRGPVFIP
ncbi:MAG TPA: hypothetical protein VN753_07270 [Terracidiphilus sp.]|nr:hypothetical protein [Terracidiphilus sp.]